MGKGGGVLPDKWETDSTGFTGKTAAEVLVVKHPAERKPHCSTLEVCKETHVLILVDIAEDAVK